MDTKVGYLVDQSHPPLVFAATQGVGEVLEHGLRGLQQTDRDVSPIILESQHRLVVINLYEPDPVCIQVIQHTGRLERMTEILGAGIGVSVLREVRRTAKALDVEITPLSRSFEKRIVKEKATVLMAYSLFKGDAPAKQARLTETLRRLQEKYRREAATQGEGTADRSDPLFLFRLTFPRAIRELERDVDEIMSGSWGRAMLEHVAEVASALAEACRVEGYRKAEEAARSISSLLSAPPEELRSVEPTFRKKLAELLSSLMREANDVLSETAS